MIDLIFIAGLCSALAGFFFAFERAGSKGYIGPVNIIFQAVKAVILIQKTPAEPGLNQTILLLKLSNNYPDQSVAGFGECRNKPFCKSKGTEKHSRADQVACQSISEKWNSHCIAIHES